MAIYWTTKNTITVLVLFLLTCLLCKGLVWTDELTFLILSVFIIGKIIVPGK